MSGWLTWPPAKELLKDLYWSGWTKKTIAEVFHKDLEEVDRLLRSYGLIPRPPERQKRETRIPRNDHAGDGYWVYCDRCRHKHILCPPKPEGCSFGYVKKSPQYQDHLLVLRDGNRCYACGFAPKDHPEERLKPWGQRRRLEKQHILPLSRGGSSCLHNLVQLCGGPDGCHTKLAAGRKYGGIPKTEPHTCSICKD